MVLASRLAAALALLLAASAPAQSAPRASLRAAVVPSTAGSKVRLPVTLVNGGAPRIYGLQFDVAPHPGLTLTRIEPGAVMAAAGRPAPMSGHFPSGETRVVLLPAMSGSKASPPLADGELVVLTFSVAATAPPTRVLPVRLLEIEAGDPDVKPVPVTGHPGAVVLPGRQP